MNRGHILCKQCLCVISALYFGTFIGSERACPLQINWIIPTLKVLMSPDRYTLCFNGLQIKNIKNKSRDRRYKLLIA